MHSIWLFTTLVAYTAAASFQNASTAYEGGKVRYDNYKVYQIKVHNLTLLSSIDALRDQHEEYDIFKEYDEISKEMQIMVAPTEVFNFEKYLKCRGLESRVLIENVQDWIDKEKQTNLMRSKIGDGYWTKYHNWDEIKNWMGNIVKQHPKVASAVVVGKTYERRTIRAIKISYKTGNPGIFIESTIHAREWIAPATATWFIHELLTSKNAAVRNLAENYDWYIVPVLNVDGYVYTHKKDRLWRKTRMPNKSSKCVGTDANRNFDYQWVAEPNKPTSNPCSDVYAGSHPFSQPETFALKNYLLSVKDKIQIYFALHSFGQFIFSPYSFSAKEKPNNNLDLMQISKAFTDAVIALPYRTNYAAGSAATLLYPSGGTSGDWAYARLGVKLSYTIELRDLGRNGFTLPAEEMLANYEEFMAGMVALVKKAKELKYV